MELAKNKLIHQIEEYVKDTFVKAEQNNDLTIAHDYKHVDRVRNWALRIAKKEEYQDLEIIEIAALLHDIGLHYLQKKDNRGKHGEVGAEIAIKYLTENSNLSEKQINNITTAIKYHSASLSKVNTILKNCGDDSVLIRIIRDADTIDAIGAIGLMRAFTSKAALPEYDPLNIKGVTWGLSSKEFDKRFEEGLGIGKYIVDQINFQISYYDNLLTESGRQFAQPLVQFTKEFLIQLESEINNNRNGS